MQQNLGLGIPMRALLVIAVGLLMLPRSGKADYFLQNIIDSGEVDFNQELAIHNEGVIGNPFAIAGPSNRAIITARNDEGQIVGFHANSANQTSELLGIGTPEASSLTLLGLGVVFVALGYKRRRS